MRRYSLLVVILGCVLVAALLTWLAVSSSHFRWGDKPTAASAPRGDTVVQKLPDFRRLDVAGNAEITLVQGSEQSVVLPTNLPRKATVTAEVREGTLRIEAADGLRWWDLLIGSGGRPAQVVVNFRDLDAIATAGSVRVAATAIRVPALKIAGAGGTQITIDELAAEQLRLSGAGALKAEIAGKVDRQNVSISGAGEYRSGKLVSQDATVSVAGAGKVVVNAQKTLKATISGAGTVEYLGDPEVTRSVSGAGSVRRRESATGGPALALAG
ncbi:MAG: head GIN domain-containing protein [Burkholderiales bacterium]